MHIAPQILAIAGLSLNLALAACGPTPADDSGGGSSTAAASTSSAGGSTTTPTPTTGGATDSTTAVSTSTTSELSSTGAGSTAGETFIVISDGGCGGVLPDGQKLRCSPEDCDPFDQDCGPGDKCVPWASGGGQWDATRCVPVAGDGGVGDPCTVEGSKQSGFDDCAFGHICWEVDDDLHGTCIAQCTGTQADPQCPEGSTCVIANNDALTVCLPNCDPLEQNCPAGDVCIANLMNPGFICAVDASGREGQANDACDFVNTCDPGLACGKPAKTSIACMGGDGCCTPFCSFPGGACPNPDQQCVSFFAPDPPPPGDEDIGLCQIP